MLSYIYLGAIWTDPRNIKKLTKLKFRSIFDKDMNIHFDPALIVCALILIFMVLYLRNRISGTKPTKEDFGLEIEIAIMSALLNLTLLLLIATIVAMFINQDPAIRRWFFIKIFFS